MRDNQADSLSVAQIQKLVHLLDRSDIAEVELNRKREGLHLVLRKFKAPEGSASPGTSRLTSSSQKSAPLGETDTVSSLHHVAAHLVGTFHPWLKPHSGTLAAVGNFVKIGQIVGTIEALNVLNEIETPVAGRIVEISIQDGQPVEYGQILITIDSSSVQ